MPVGVGVQVPKATVTSHGERRTSRRAPATVKQLRLNIFTLSARVLQELSHSIFKHFCPQNLGYCRTYSHSVLKHFVPKSGVLQNLPPTLFSSSSPSTSGVGLVCPHIGMGLQQFVLRSGVGSQRGVNMTSYQGGKYGLLPPW